MLFWAVGPLILKPEPGKPVTTKPRTTLFCPVMRKAPISFGKAPGLGSGRSWTIGREAFEWLDAPVFRLGALDTPAPFAKVLEALYSPKDRLVPTLRDLLSY